MFVSRYIQSSTKGCTRTARAGDASRVYSLRTFMKLPPQKVILTVSKNKAQLIDLICEDLETHKEEFEVI